MMPSSSVVRIKHRVKNTQGKTAEQIEETLDYISWEIFIDAPAETLRQIKKVEYYLHPTYPESKVVRSNVDEKFEYKTFGYMSFDIEVKIFLEGGKSITGIYPLTIGQSNEVGKEINFNF